MPALTLAEAQKDAENGGLREKATVIELFRRNSDLFESMMFPSIMGSAYQYNIESALPTSSFRGVNEDFSPTHGVVSPQVEAMKIVGGQIKVDRALMKMHGERAYSRQLNMKIKAVVRSVANNIIKGDSGSDAREFDGLQNRIAIGDSQAISNGSSSGGDAPSLANLDDAIDNTAEATHILMNRSLKTKLIGALRDTSVTGHVTQTKDAFGRTQDRYRDLPILTGYPKSKGDDFLPFEESATGGGSTASSIYVVSIREDGLHMPQVGELDVGEPEKVSQGTGIWQDIEWILTMAIEDPFAVTRLNSISDSAWVA